MELSELRKVFPLIAIYTTLIPISIAVYNFKYLDISMKLILAYLTISFAIDQVTWFYFISMRNNMPIINCFVLLEPMIFIYILYHWELVKPENIKHSYILMLLVLAFWMNQAFFSYDSNGAMGIYGPMLIFSTFIGGFNSVLSSTRLLRLVSRVNNLKVNYRFWTISGIFFYCTCTLIVVSTNYLVPKSAWILFNITNIIYYLILANAFITCRKY